MVKKYPNRKASDIVRKHNIARKTADVLTRYTDSDITQTDRDCKIASTPQQLLNNLKQTISLDQFHDKGHFSAKLL